MLIRCAVILLATLLVSSAPRSISIPIFDNLSRLIQQEDTDHDLRITIHDRITPFSLRDARGTAVRSVAAVHQLSVLLQELKGAADQGEQEIPLDRIRLNESVVDRTSRIIRERYWDALTRRIDAAHIDAVVSDNKVAGDADYVYVPGDDSVALGYFRRLEQDARSRGRAPALKVQPLPPVEMLTGDFVRRLDGRHGILSLKIQFDDRGRPRGGTPYVVPGGRFNELYYWDSYFIVLGLLHDGRIDLARSMAENMLYALQHYGKVPNANRTYYLTRSQPPFLTSIIRAVHRAQPQPRSWLQSALKLMIAEYRKVWLSPERLVRIGPHRLSRYFDSGEGPCPEVEPGHYDAKLAPWIEAASQTTGRRPLPAEFLTEYRRYEALKADGLTLAQFYKHDRAVRESGHDTTHRFDDRTADFVTVDLNALLCRYELDFAELLEQEFGGRIAGLGEDGAAQAWRRRAEDRKRSMIELMWSSSSGYFFDFDTRERRRSRYISATGLYPLWAGMLDANDPTERARIRRIAAFVTEKLEQPSGLAASAPDSVAAARRKDARQWDYPFGWPPHQMLAWEGLRRCGLAADAERLAYRWLHTIAVNARDYNGTVPEKYDVTTGSHRVFVEYGNVGTDFAYIAPEGFGWMNASFQVGIEYLSAPRRKDLQELKPPSTK